MDKAARNVSASTHPTILREYRKKGAKATAASMVMDTLKKRGAVDEKSAVDVSAFKNLPYATSTISYTISNLIEEGVVGKTNDERFYYDDLGLAKLSMYVENDLDLLLNQFRDLFKNYEVMATSKDYIEITKKGTNKWESFCHLPVEDAIFIGDGENDLCILKNLKNTYVMDHAPESLKVYGVCVKSVAQAIDIESRKENV